MVATLRICIGKVDAARAPRIAGRRV